MNSRSEIATAARCRSRHTSTATPRAAAFQIVLSGTLERLSHNAFAADFSGLALA
jgi:hypothetical protein